MWLKATLIHMYYVLYTLYENAIVTIFERRQCVQFVLVHVFTF